MSRSSLPVLDIAPILAGAEASSPAAKNFQKSLHNAMRNVGFFYLVGHGISNEHCKKL